MDTIIFATGNKNKMIEIRMILADLGCKILSQKEAGIQADVVEDGQTFEENALIKATTDLRILHGRCQSIKCSCSSMMIPGWKIDALE